MKTIGELLEQIHGAPIVSLTCEYDIELRGLRFNAFVQVTKATDYGSLTDGRTVGIAMPYRDIFASGYGFEAQRIRTLLLMEFDTTAHEYEGKTPKKCHVCGQSHPMALTPFPLVPRDDKTTFCPYDVNGTSVL
jgi:hypothetical protein